jgi:hypothetical protein
VVYELHPVHMRHGIICDYTTCQQCVYRHHTLQRIITWAATATQTCATISASPTIQPQHVRQRGNCTLYMRKRPACFHSCPGRRHGSVPWDAGSNRCGRWLRAYAALPGAASPGAPLTALPPRPAAPPTAAAPSASSSAETRAASPGVPCAGAVQCDLPGNLAPAAGRRECRARCSQRCQSQHCPVQPAECCPPREG